MAENDRLLKQTEKSGFDLDWPVVGPGVEAADLGVVAVNRQLSFQDIDQVQSRDRRDPLHRAC